MTSTAFHPIDPSQGYCKTESACRRPVPSSFHPIDPSQGYCKITATARGGNPGPLSSNRPEPRVLQAAPALGARPCGGLSSNRPEPRVLQEQLQVVLPAAVGLSSNRPEPRVLQVPLHVQPLQERRGFHPIDPSQGYCKLHPRGNDAGAQSFHPIDPSQGYCKSEGCPFRPTTTRLSSNRPEPRVLQEEPGDIVDDVAIAFIQSTRAKGTASSQRAARTPTRSLSSNRPEPRVLQAKIKGMVPDPQPLHPIDPSQGYCKCSFCHPSAVSPDFHPIDPSQGYCKLLHCGREGQAAGLSSNRPEPRVLQGSRTGELPLTGRPFIQSTRAKGTASTTRCRAGRRRRPFIQSTRAKGTARIRR